MTATRPSNSDSALTELRLSTRDDHAHVERILRLTQPMSLERYAIVMLGFDAFLRAWEPLVQDAMPRRLQQWFRARWRGGFASADVEWLRSAGVLAAPTTTAQGIPSIPMRDLPEVMGSLYVIEGSALGGRVITPQLKTTLGLEPGHGASYFHGFGGATGSMWTDFRAVASIEIGDSSGARARACGSAGSTFGALIEHFAALATESPVGSERRG